MISIIQLSFINFLCVITVTSVASTDMNITIPLNKMVTINDKLLFEDFIYLNTSSKIQVKFSNVNNGTNFIIFQVHSHLAIIDVYKNVKVKQSYMSGTDIGMYSLAQPLTDVYYIESSKKNVDLKLYIAVHGYKQDDLIPGGCNMEFPNLAISPYIRPTYRGDYIFVDAATAGATDDPDCRKIIITNYEFYMLYLPETNFDTDVYFDGIRTMMNEKNIKAKAILIPKTVWETRRMVSAYPGIGTIYVALAKENATNKSSIYVPAYTYACTLNAEQECNLIDDDLSQILCALLFFIGIFVCYFGHRFFKTEMFIIGYLSGFVITYILMSVIAVLDQAAVLAVSTLSGVLFGAMWLMFWWLYAIPVVAVLLSSLNVGFLVASIIYNYLPSFLFYAMSDLNFWSIFTLTTLLTALALVSMTNVANILSCAILGGYATVFCIDFYVGSGFKYTLINTIRRAVVPNFNNAVLLLPFQVRDNLLTVLWVVLASTGVLFQTYQNHGRPPFPPPPRSIRPEDPATVAHGNSDIRRSNMRPTASASDERTPLLSPNIPRV